MLAVYFQNWDGPIGHVRLMLWPFICRDANIFKINSSVLEDESDCLTSPTSWEINQLVKWHDGMTIELTCHACMHIDNKYIDQISRIRIRRQV